MKLEIAVVARTAGHGIIRLGAVGGFERHRLAGEELQPPGARCLEMQQRHVFAQRFDFLDARGDLLCRDVLCAADLGRLDFQVGHRRVGAEQHVTLVFFRITENIIGMAHRQRFSGNHPGLAQAAIAVAASITQGNAGAQRGIQNGVRAFHEELALARHEADMGGHEPEETLLDDVGLKIVAGRLLLQFMPQPQLERPHDETDVLTAGLFVLAEFVIQPVGDGFL